MPYFSGGESMEVLKGKVVELLYPFFNSFVEELTVVDGYDPFLISLWDDTVTIFTRKRKLYIFYDDIAKYYFADRWDELSEEDYDNAKADTLIILAEEETKDLPDEWFDEPHKHYKEWEQFTKELWLKSLSDSARDLYDFANAFHELKEAVV